MPAVYRRRTGIVSGERQRQIVVNTASTERQDMRYRPLYFLLVQSCQPRQVCCRFRHQLHQPTRSGSAYGTCIATALLTNDAGQQVDIQIVLRARACLIAGVALARSILFCLYLQQICRNCGFGQVYFGKIHELIRDNLSRVYFHKI